MNIAVLYLSQAVSLPPSLGSDWDFFQHINLVQEVKLEPAAVTFGVVVALLPAISLQSGQARSGKTGPFLGLIARDRLRLPWKVGHGCRNPAHQEVRTLVMYLQSYSFFYVVCAIIL